MASVLNLTEQQIEEIQVLFKDVRSSAPNNDRQFNVASLDPESPDYDQRVLEIANQKSVEIHNAIIKRGELKLGTHKLLTP